MSYYNHSDVRCINKTFDEINRLKRSINMEFINDDV